jgi:hypothetical protein
MKMKTQQVKVGDFVVVDTEGGKPGQVRYLKGNWIGVSLVNEKGRVDEWQASQVQKVSPEQASQLARKFVKLVA